MRQPKQTVDFTDFILFAEALGGTEPAFDLDRSGSVDSGDFVIFAVAFGTAGSESVSRCSVSVPIAAVALLADTASQCNAVTLQLLFWLNPSKAQ